VLVAPDRPEAVALVDREFNSPACRRWDRLLVSAPLPEEGVERLGWRKGSTGTERSGDHRF
jgi:hypothetical protein